MSTLDELERELGPRLRATLDEMLAGPDAAPGDRDVAPSRPGTPVVPLERADRPRRTWLVAAAAVVIAVVGVAALAATRTSDPAVPADTVPTTTPATTIDATDPVPPTTALTWTTADNLGSLARSSVNGIVTGPTGYVATGMGFDAPRNQGRVWFSTDGLVWQEPALEIFESLEVSAPIATSTAFYVVGATNTDWTPESEGEGQPTVPDAHLYRSVDGVTWERWGDSLDEPRFGIFGLDDGLLRTDHFAADPADRTPWWSADGLTWSRADFENPDSDFGIGGPLGAATVGERYYAIGFRYVPDAWDSVWESSDGLRWNLLPDPPASGRIIEASDSLLLVSSGAVHRFEPTSRQWQPVPGDVARTAPSEESIVVFDDLLIAASVGEDPPPTVWTTPSERIAWQVDPTVEPPLDPIGTGVAAAASDDQVILIWHTTGVGGTTVVQLGTLATP